MRTTSSSDCWFCGSAGVVVCADAAAQRMAAARKKASASLLNLKSPFKSIRLVEYFGQGRPKASKGVRDFDARITEHGCRKSESGRRPKQGLFILEPKASKANHRDTEGTEVAQRVLILNPSVPSPCPLCLCG